MARSLILTILEKRLHSFSLLYSFRPWKMCRMLDADTLCEAFHTGPTTHGPLSMVSYARADPKWTTRCYKAIGCRLQNTPQQHSRDFKTAHCVLVSFPLLYFLVSLSISLGHLFGLVLEFPKFCNP